jgi:hypothetical protein
VRSGKNVRVKFASVGREKGQKSPDRTWGRVRKAKSKRQATKQKTKAAFKSKSNHKLKLQCR